jgi:hypothetical protein
LTWGSWHVPIQAPDSELAIFREKIMDGVERDDREFVIGGLFFETPGTDP